MIKNYIKIAWRNLIRNKGYASINIVGLTVGLSACMLLVLFARFELSYDAFHKKAERIYRMASVTETSEEVIKRAYSPVPLARTLTEEFPEVEKATHISRVQNARIKIGQETSSAEDFYWADPDIFDIFSFSVLKGSRSTFFQHPNSVVITRSVAAVRFPDTDPLGKTIQLSDNTYTITGVVDDWPANAHFHPKFIATFSTLPAHEDKSWSNFNTRTYFLLHDKASIGDLQDKLAAEIDKRIDQVGPALTFIPQALTDIHLHSSLEGELEPNGSITTIYVVLSIALLILLNACVNYINLSTAQARKRAREIGIRKTFGSGRKSLVLQFMGETFLVTGISFLCSLLLVESSIPIFNNLFNQQLHSDMLFDPIVMGVFLGIWIVTSILAGAYPAFYLTSLSVTDVLKGKIQLRNFSAHSPGRKGAIMFQFLITIILIVSSLVILRQLQFIQQKDLGFEEHNLVVIPLGTGGERESFNALKSKLMRNPDILGVTSAVNYPGRGYIGQNHWYAGEKGAGERAQMGFVAPNFLEVFDISLAKGRDFREKAGPQSVIINETAVKRFGLGNNPIGKKITRTAPGAKDRTMYEVIGVTEDFNTASLREAIEPVVLYPVNFNVNMIIRVARGQVSGAINVVREAFNEVNPHAAFEYRFVTDLLSGYYRSDQNFFEIIVSFTLLAIFIAGLGLLGLVGYMIQDRIKEFAIRKVLGATITNIITLLSKDFLKMVTIGFVIAIPIAWYAMHRWLQDFAYKIEIGPGIFLFAGGVAMLIALATVGWQSVRAAVANPVESLRNE